MPEDVFQDRSLKLLGHPSESCNGCRLTLSTAHDNAKLAPVANTGLSGERQANHLTYAHQQSRTLATSPRASLVARPGLDSPPFPGLVCCRAKKNGAP